MRPADRIVARDPYLLLAVGRLEPYKRVHWAIEVLEELPPVYRLVVVGDGPARPSLERSAQDHGVADRVTFVGQVSEEDLAVWYRRAKVLVNLSTAEAFGLTALEALSAGCRVVCSDIPAFRELSARFSNWISVVRNNHLPLLPSVIEAAARHADLEPPDLIEFSWSRAVDSLLILYRRLTDTREDGTIRAGATSARRAHSL
jgi:glycosyltransferase involved in cell wall biosynthesis